MAALPWSQRRFILSNGVSIPSVGFGTFKIRREDDIDTSVRSAVEVSGYRLVDTAAVYRNEHLIAKRLKNIFANEELKLKREDLFLTSKLAPRDHGSDKCRSAIQTTLDNLNTSYLDLYLIHWPGVQGLQVDDRLNVELRQQSWKVLEEFHDRGVLKSIGVSNYNVRHLEELLAECKIKPHVNQVEIHPHFPQAELVSFCRSHNIHIQAYSSLGTTVDRDSNPLLNDPVVQAIAQDLGKSSAQVLLVWALQQGFSVIPKSTNPKHIDENIRLDFALSEEEMEKLNSLSTMKRKYAWNPDSVI